MTWLFVFGSNSMDVLSVEIIDGEKNKVEVRNWDKVGALVIWQALAMIFFYVELYFITQLRKPQDVRLFFAKSLGLALLTLFTSVVLVREVIYPDNTSVRELDSLVPILVFYVAIAVCYGFTKKWIVHEQVKNQLLLNKNQAQLSMLRQQLQPHFLFNTMNNLLAMVDQKENPTLATSIDKLSGLLRYVVYDIHHQKITIKDEISFIQNFIDLHMLRFEENEIDLQFQVKGNFDQQPIEPGVFLCYIENAFKHGVQPEEHAFIYIQIDLTEQGRVSFSIENSIPEKPFQYTNGGFGLKSNTERLALIYPESHTLSIEKNDTYSVHLTINSFEGNYSR